jgi:hypothetical protein
MAFVTAFIGADPYDEYMRASDNFTVHLTFGDSSSQQGSNGNTQGGSTDSDCYIQGDVRTAAYEQINITANA